MATVPRPDVDRLVETFRSYSHAIAAEVLRKFPSLEKDELRGAAELGLVEAANSFDPSRGVLFKTFAYYRIRGAIYDSLRKMGWFAKESPRLRFESGANEYMKDHADAAPPGGSPEESLQELKEITTAVVSCYFLSLFPASRSKSPKRVRQSPEEEYLKNEEKTNLRRAMTRLPEKNREVLEAIIFGTKPRRRSVSGSASG